MLIIGCDYHPSFQQIAFVDTNTGQCGERRLEHMEEAERFYRDVRNERQRGQRANAGMGHQAHDFRPFPRFLFDGGRQFGNGRVDLIEHAQQVFRHC